MSAFSQVKPTFRSLQTSNNIKQHKSMSFRLLPQSCKRLPGSFNQLQTTAAMASIISPLSGYYIIHTHTRNITNAFNCEAISGECLRILYFDSINVCDYLFRPMMKVDSECEWVSVAVCGAVCGYRFGLSVSRLSVCLPGWQWMNMQWMQWIHCGGPIKYSLFANRAQNCTHKLLIDM